MIHHMARNDQSIKSTTVYIISGQQLLQGPWPRPGRVEGPRRASAKRISRVTIDTHTMI
jgi:hypothetical protein